MQCCLGPLGKHCIWFWPVEYCPKSIRTTLNEIFSCALLSAASMTTLHRIFICAISPLENHLLGQLCTRKTLCSLALEASYNIASEKTLFTVVLILFGQHYIANTLAQSRSRGSQHCIRISPSRCCLNTFEAKLLVHVIPKQNINYKTFSWSGLINTAPKYYLCNVGLQSTNKFPQENNLELLDLSEKTLHKEIICAILADG